MSLRWKIAGGFAVLLALVLLLGWVTLSLLGSLAQAQRQVFDEAIPGLRAVDEVVRSFTAQSAAVRGYAQQPFNMELFEQYERERRIANKSLEELRRLFGADREPRLLFMLIEAGQEFQSVVDNEVIPAAKQGERSSAFRVLAGKGAALIGRIESLGEQLRGAQDMIVEQTENDLRDGASRAVVIVAGALVLAVGLGLLLAIALPGRLVANLGRLVTAARAVGRGDFDRPVEIRSRDEVAELAERFNEMQAGLKRLQQLALQDRELAIAASIQRNLLQRRLPEIAGASVVPLQRQANLVGGDWYDVDVAGKTLTVAVGDASGKGIGAALMATVALSVLRAERGLGAGPRRIVERANQALRDATEPDSFTTVIYSSLDLDTGQVRWLNMGHPSPYLLSRDDVEGAVSGRFVDGPRNRALGWFEDPGLAEASVRLSPGDRLLLFTDGFLEAKSPEGEIFGEKRFAAELVRLGPLDVEGMLHELVGSVERFAAGKLDDDLTMLVVEFQGAPLEEGAVQRLTGERTWHSRR